MMWFMCYMTSVYAVVCRLWPVRHSVLQPQRCSCNHNLLLYFDSLHPHRQLHWFPNRLRKQSQNHTSQSHTEQIGGDIAVMSWLQWLTFSPFVGAENCTEQTCAVSSLEQLKQLGALEIDYIMICCLSIKFTDIWLPEKYCRVVWCFENSLVRCLWIRITDVLKEIILILLYAIDVIWKQYKINIRSCIRVCGCNLYCI